MCSCVYRLKSSMLVAARGAHSLVQFDPVDVSVMNNVACELPEWDDAYGTWYKMIASRYSSIQRSLASQFLSFVASMLAVVRCMACKPGDRGAGARSVLAKVEAEKQGNNGVVRMSAIISTFPNINGELFLAILQHMRWAGFLKKLHSVIGLKFGVQAILACYNAHQTRYFTRPDGLLSVEEANVFTRCQVPFKQFVVSMKVTGANVADKPTPLVEGDLRKCAEMAYAGSITPLYGIVLAFIKSICGCRNPVFASWTWSQITFFPTVVWNEEANCAEVCLNLVSPYLCILMCGLCNVCLCFR